MRGKITACDNCRKKKVKCEGTNPCKYCVNHFLVCTFNSVPKKISPYTFKKKVNRGNTATSTFKSTNDEIQSRLNRMDLLLDSMLEKIDHQNNNSRTSSNFKTSISTERNVNCVSSERITDNAIDSDLEVKTVTVVNRKSSSFESYDRMVFGDYFSISFFSGNGLMWAANRIHDPFVFNPVKNLISKFVSFERSLFTVWSDPVDTSRLAALPSREIMETFAETYFKVCLFDLNYVYEVRDIAKRYCDYRDGLISKPKFSYGELLFLNSCLLAGASVYLEKIKLGIQYVFLTAEKVQIYERLLLDNTLYYFHRISLMGDGIVAIKGLTLLCFFADAHSLTQPLYSIVSHAVRQSMDIGLHRNDYYDNLGTVEKFSSLSVWWVCYYLDKFSALQTGKLPIINDKLVTAPPLKYFKEYSDNLGLEGPRAGLKRKSLQNEISKKFENMIKEPNGHKIFYFVMEIDLGIIISKLYSHLSSCSTFNVNNSSEEVVLLLDELENWALCLPESIKPGGPIFEHYATHLYSIKEICVFCIVSDLNIKYYHLKILFNMLAFRNSNTPEKNEFAKKALSSAKELLKFAVKIGKRVLQIASFSLFYSFSAFLTISAFCIQDPSRDEIAEDVYLLILSCRELFSRFSKAMCSSEKSIMIGSVTRCMLYIVVHVVMEHNSNLSFDIGDILEEVSAIQKDLKYNHMSSYFQDKVYPHIENPQVLKISEIPMTSSSLSSSLGSTEHFIGDVDELTSSNAGTSNQLTNVTLPLPTESCDLDNFLGLVDDNLFCATNELVTNVLLPTNNPVSFENLDGNSGLGQMPNLDDFFLSTHSP